MLILWKEGHTTPSPILLSRKILLQEYWMYHTKEAYVEQGTMSKRVILEQCIVVKASRRAEGKGGIHWNCKQRAMDFRDSALP
jgi:hypothetical protein